MYSDTQRHVLWRQLESGDNLHENRGSFCLSRSITMLSLATICVALRFWCRKIRVAKYARDDWMLLAALFVVYGVGAANLAEVANGLGRHASTLSFEMRARFFMSLYVMEWFYVTSVTVTKFALLLLYLRIFAVSTRFRLMVYFVATTVALWAVVLYIVLALQCDPVHAAWQPWVQARCLSIKWIQVGNAVPNITTDVIILSLPLTQIPKLKVSFAQKLSLCVTFMLGGFVIIASAVRLYVLITQMDLNDATWSFLEPCTWCVIELTSGVISVCLPTLWPLIVHASKTYSKYMPSRFSSKSKSLSIPNYDRAIMTIGGGPNRRIRGKESGDKPSEVLGLSCEVTLTSKLSTSSHDEACSDTYPIEHEHEHAKPDFQV